MVYSCHRAGGASARSPRGYRSSHAVVPLSAIARVRQRFTFVKKLLLHLGHTDTSRNNERSLRQTHTHTHTHVSRRSISICSELLEKQKTRLQSREPRVMTDLKVPQRRINTATLLRKGAAVRNAPISVELNNIVSVCFGLVKFLGLVLLFVVARGIKFSFSLSLARYRYLVSRLFFPRCCLIQVCEGKKERDGLKWYFPCSVITQMDFDRSIDRIASVRDRADCFRIFLESFSNSAAEILLHFINFERIAKIFGKSLSFVAHTQGNKWQSVNDFCNDKIFVTIAIFQLSRSNCHRYCALRCLS